MARPHLFATCISTPLRRSYRLRVKHKLYHFCHPIKSRRPLLPRQTHNEIWHGANAADANRPWRSIRWRWPQGPVWQVNRVVRTGYIGQKMERRHKRQKALVVEDIWNQRGFFFFLVTGIVSVQYTSDNQISGDLNRKFAKARLSSVSKRLSWVMILWCGVLSDFPSPTWLLIWNFKPVQYLSLPILSGV